MKSISDCASSNAPECSLSPCRPRHAFPFFEPNVNDEAQLGGSLLLTAHCTLVESGSSLAIISYPIALISLALVALVEGWNQIQDRVTLLLKPIERVLEGFYAENPRATLRRTEKIFPSADCAEDRSRWPGRGHVSTSVCPPLPHAEREHGLGPRFPIALSGRRLRRPVAPPDGARPIYAGDMSCLGLSLADRDAASGAGEPDMRLHCPFRQGESPRYCRYPVSQNRPSGSG